MHHEPDTQQNSPTAVAEVVAPRSPWRVTEVVALPKFRLRVAFTDGSKGTVDLSRLVHSPKAGVFAPLADASLFQQVSIEYELSLARRA